MAKRVVSLPDGTTARKLVEVAEPMIEKAKWTPGPWRAIPIQHRKSHQGYRVEQAAPRYPKNPGMSDVHLRIGEVYSHRFGSADSVPGHGMNDLSGAATEGCQEANARLIVLAPDLVECLSEIRDLFTGIETRHVDEKAVDDWYTKADKLLARLTSSE